MSDALSREQVEHLVCDGGDDSAELYLLNDAWLRARIVELEQERDGWHADASSHLLALCEKQAEVNGLEQQLAQAHAHLEAQRQETYRAVEREQAAKRTLAQCAGWQTCETHGALNADHVWGCPSCVVALRAQLAAAQAEINRLKESQP